MTERLGIKEQLVAIFSCPDCMVTAFDASMSMRPFRKYGDGLGPTYGFVDRDRPFTVDGKLCAKHWSMLETGAMP